MLEQVRYRSFNGWRAVRRWVVPYLASRLHPDQFRPVLCYIFTEWRCNLDCHYCFQYDNHRPAMDLATFRAGVDWLKSLGCRVAPLMGGEPLLRPEFTLQAVEYAARQGFFVYLPTNGRLLTNSLIDDLGRAGVAAVNLAVDCVEPRPGLPKSLARIQDQFERLVAGQARYGYLLFFNINICRTNLADVRRLTELAFERRIGTDYHLNEPPQGFVDVAHYHHRDDGLHLTSDQWAEADALLDWLMARHDRQPMVNSKAHLAAFKSRMRGVSPPWDCRAGLNGALIRPDGSLAPCFDLITLDHDWGRLGAPRFPVEELEEIKTRCRPKCSSTCFQTMGHYYNLANLPQWVAKHARLG